MGGRAGRTHDTGMAFTRIINTDERTYACSCLRECG